MKTTSLFSRQKVYKGSHPGVTRLIIISVIVFLGQLFIGKFLVNFFGLQPYFYWHRFFWWQAVTYLFLNGGLWGLFLNLFVLWMFGRDLEYSWGTRFFLKYFFITGIGAGLCIASFSPGLKIPVIGCSGAIYGILLASAIEYPNKIIKFPFTIMPVKAKYFILIYFFLDFYYALFTRKVGIIHIAHFGAIVIGYIYLRHSKIRKNINKLKNKSGVQNLYLSDKDLSDKDLKLSKNYIGLNLQGKSFKGQDLSGEDFSRADIRGANFEGTKLVGTNFSHVKAGIRSDKYDRFDLILFIVLICISFVLGLMSPSSISYLVHIINETVSEVTKSTPNISIIHILMINTVYFFYLVTNLIAIKYKKFFYSVGIWIGAGVILLTVPLAFILIIQYLTLSMGFIQIINTFLDIWIKVMPLSIYWAKSWLFTTGVLLTLASSISMAITIGTWYTGISILSIVFILGSIPGLIHNNTMGFLAIVGISTLPILSSFIARQTLLENREFATLRKIAIYLTSLFGTNFKDANLNYANFYGADLKHIRLNRKTTTMHTCWLKTEGLKFSYLSGTILENKIVRELLVSGMGNDMSFNKLNFQGAFLNGTKLYNSDFTESDISKAALEKADLRNTNLTKAQALGTDFKDADLTGACLESWNIDSSTNLEGAHADYVYLLNNQKERRPSSGNFKKGEFTKLFQQVLNTVDFIFKNGIDWKAFILSFDKLREKVKVESEDAEISIQSIENKGDGVFVIKVNVPPEMNKEKIHKELKQEYDKKLKLIEEKYIALLEAKDEIIENKQKFIDIYKEQNIDLKEIIHYQAKRPIQIYPKEEVRTMSYEKSEINIKGDITGSTINLGQIGGDISNIIQQIPSSDNPDEAGLKEMLIQLKDIIEKASDKDLKPDDKKDALEEIKTIATIGKDSNPNEKEKSNVRKSIKFFKGLISELPVASKLATELIKLITAISTKF